MELSAFLFQNSIKFYSTYILWVPSFWYYRMHNLIYQINIDFLLKFRTDLGQFRTWLYLFQFDCFHSCSAIVMSIVFHLSKNKFRQYKCKRTTMTCALEAPLRFIHINTVDVVILVFVCSHTHSRFFVRSICRVR